MKQAALLFFLLCFALGGLSFAGENFSEKDGFVVNINKCTLEELEELNGIGPDLAARIISYREESGRFERIDDLKNVKGIGEKKFDSVKKYLKV